MAGWVALAFVLGGLAAGPGTGTALQAPPEADAFVAARAAMVADQIERRGVADPRVLHAMRDVPRHRFVPEGFERLAYADRPLPIGHDQTISQPYIVAYMTEALEVDRTHTVLEIGTGSGYQAAVLARLARSVYTIEIVPELAQRAANTLKTLGYANVQVRAGDGYAGWPERAPFDRIMVTAAPDQIPQPLIDQLRPGGRMVIPVGSAEQWITVVDKTPSGVTRRRTIPVRFVPFTRSRE
jgi:protein-L-isoaspartate(D-aspartate) O-methyltransferase